MNTKRHSKYTKTIILALTGLVVVVLAYGCLAYFRGWLPFSRATSTSDPNTGINKVSYDPATKDQTNAGSQAKDNSSSQVNEATVERDQANGQSTATQTTQSVDVLITSANYSNGILKIRAMISTIDASGTCMLTLSRPGASDITKTAPTQTMGSYTTCQGFDVSEVIAGTWQAKVQYQGSLNRSGSAQKEVTV